VALNKQTNKTVTNYGLYRILVNAISHFILKVKTADFSEMLAN